LLSVKLLSRDVTQRGSGDAWAELNGEKLAQASYEHTVSIHAAWAGRAISLDLTRVSTDAVVFIFQSISCGMSVGIFLPAMKAKGEIPETSISPCDDGCSLCLRPLSRVTYQALLAQ